MRHARLCSVLLVTACAPADSAPPPDAAASDAAAHDGSVDDAGADAPASLQCPESYTLSTTQGTRYRVNAQRTTWVEAATDCADDGDTAHLMVPASEHERAEIRSAIPPEDGWIGLSFRRGTLQWVTAEPAPVPGATGDPWSIAEPDEATQCVVMDRTMGQFFEEDCVLKRTYVCECDAFANDPTRY